MPEAARLGDHIGHTGALAGLLAGALVGIAFAVTVVAVVGTGGLAAVAIGAGAAATGAGAALSGAYIGEAIETSPTGTIITGSFDVFIGGLAHLAARAGRDVAACSGMLLFSHDAPLIAQGSPTVLINGMMAARKGEKVVCGGRIRDGCGTVIIGGPTATVPGLAIDSEVPGWLTTYLQVQVYAGMAIAIVATPVAFGVVAAFGLGGGVLGSLALSWVGKKVGRFIGDIFGNAELGARIGEVTGGALGGLLGGWAGAKGGERLIPERPPRALPELAESQPQPSQSPEPGTQSLSKPVPKGLTNEGQGGRENRRLAKKFDRWLKDAEPIPERTSKPARDQEPRPGIIRGRPIEPSTKPPEDPPKGGIYR